MGIPDFEAIMRPLLVLHEDGLEKTQGELGEALAVSFEVSPEELEEENPSGTAYTFASRVAWASTHMKQAGLIEKPRRGISVITDRGRAALVAHPERIDISVLEQFQEYSDVRARSRTGSASVEEASAAETPEETLDAAFNELRHAVVEDLRSRLIAGGDALFQDVVLDVLVALRYGGSKREVAQRFGRSGDGGIDGVIREDALGLDAIYVHAKRWARERTIGPREIQEFIGALQDAEASKGVFITTSSFSPDARELARRRRVVLLDGSELAGLMMDAHVGVTAVRRLDLKRVDEDYFTGPA